MDELFLSVKNGITDEGSINQVSLAVFIFMLLQSCQLSINESNFTFLGGAYSLKR